MVEQPSNKQVEQRKETSATARRRSPPAPRLPSPSTTPATYTVALESVSEALDGLRNHARAGRTGCAQRPRRLDFAPPLRGRLRGQLARRQAQTTPSARYRRGPRKPRTYDKGERVRALVSAAGGLRGGRGWEHGRSTIARQRRARRSPASGEWSILTPTSVGAQLAHG